MKAYFKITHIALLLFFFGVILLPSINSEFHLFKEKTGNENRTKAVKPNDTIPLSQYIKAYDDYYTDNFSLRDNIIEQHNRFELSFFNVSPVPDGVVVGKDGW